MKVGWQIKLQLELLYENGVPVPNQSMLELSNDSSLIIDGTGTCKLSLRITEVSMTHENRNFRIRVSCIDSTNGPIEPALSSSMTVM